MSRRCVSLMSGVGTERSTMSALRSDGQSSGWKHLMPASFILPMMAGTTSKPVRLTSATPRGERDTEERTDRASETRPDQKRKSLQHVNTEQ